MSHSASIALIHDIHVLGNYRHRLAPAVADGPDDRITQGDGLPGRYGRYVAPEYRRYRVGRGGPAVNQDASLYSITGACRSRSERKSSTPCRDRNLKTVIPPAVPGGLSVEREVREGRDGGGVCRA